MKSYKEIALDIIEILKVNNIISTSDLITILKNRYNLSKEVLECRTKCNRQFLFNNRVIVARSFLVKQNAIILDKNKNIKYILNS